MPNRRAGLRAEKNSAARFHAQFAQRHRQFDVLRRALAHAEDAAGADA